MEQARSNLDSLVETSQFDPSLSKAGLWGNGTYFARDASGAHQYALVEKYTWRKQAVAVAAGTGEKGKQPAQQGSSGGTAGGSAVAAGGGAGGSGCNGGALAVARASAASGSATPAPAEPAGEEYEAKGAWEDRDDADLDDGDEVDVHTILLCLVATGVSTLGYNGMNINSTNGRANNASFDSAVDNLLEPTTWVVTGRTQSLIAYKLEYRAVKRRQ